MLSDKALPQEKMTALEAKVKELENGEDCTKRIEDDEEEEGGFLIIIMVYCCSVSLRDNLKHRMCS